MDYTEALIEEAKQRANEWSFQHYGDPDITDLGDWQIPDSKKLSKVVRYWIFYKVKDSHRHVISVAWACFKFDKFIGWRRDFEDDLLDLDYYEVFYCQDYKYPKRPPAYDKGCFVLDY